MTKISNRLTAIFLIIALCLVINTMTASAATIPTPTIVESQGIAYNTAAFSLQIPMGYDCEIYRATEENGTYKHIDTLQQSAHLIWEGLDNGYWQTDCANKKIVCLRSDDESIYIFYDSSLKFGKTYYYKVRFIEGGSSGDFSSVTAVSPALDGADVTIIKGYANSSYKPKLYWNGIMGSQGYNVYRKESGDWKRVKTVKGARNLIYTDTTAKKGKLYSYRIRAYRVANGKTYYSAYSKPFKVSTKTPTVKGKYSKGSVYGPYLSIKELQDVKRAVQGFKLNYIKSGMSNYEKIEAAYDFMRNTCAYAYAGWQYNQANTAWGSLVYGEAQCSGYARGLKALCDAVGIPCYFVHANSKSLNPNHQWNQVKIDGKWYIVDSQGGYFLVSAETYRFTGMRWNTKNLPACKEDYFK